ncbi:ubiquinone biosynthesis protein UbiA [Formosa sp. Hel1_33_131]|mgnify:FL=1|jgi:4-hydroxybenzoate polyprenyltransferase|uniref:geranylgeranylglycerol-phosphate geranylgeranyltransferase n=1 Tax=Formosa sp. Hel1_33_131 TaxID=1336794 RepID=UPI00084E2BCE|nr:geranylgeranylglycerol-phosphate geranylgeranyltransferase [Formosa sp. Hel1_33_131]AOR27911.1 ubiquinone biosynthesis protein UbiA [Formosa sp. Hel1_33_131]
MVTPIQKQIILKLFSMFVVVRGFNLALIVIAQYITAVFIMAPSSQSLSEILFDHSLFALILATVGAIGSGYIINNFYDSEKDSINRPRKSTLEQYVSQNTKLILYFIINFIVVIIASYVSFRSVLFFSFYIFSIWFYSHKIKKRPIIGNLISAILTITPFFAIFLYYKNYSGLIFVFGFYLFLILAMRELVKDLENLKGDLTLDYKTVPVVYGEKTAKIMIALLVMMNILVTGYLVSTYDLGKMDYFFYGSMSLLSVVVILIYKAKSQRQFVWVHNLLRLLILLGVFSIVLLNPSLILSKLL